MCKKNDSLIFGIGIIAGVIGGVIAGVMYAPKSGEESRKEVKDVLGKLIEEQAPNVINAKKQASEAIDLIKYKVEKQIKKVSNALKSEKLEKAKKLEDGTTDYDIN